VVNFIGAKRQRNVLSCLGIPNIHDFQMKPESRVGYHKLSERSLSFGFFPSSHESSHFDRLKSSQELLSGGYKGTRVHGNSQVKSRVTHRRLCGRVVRHER